MFILVDIDILHSDSDWLKKWPYIDSLLCHLL